MITLQKGQIQYIYLTLTEKQTISSPNYLFVFEQRSTNTSISGLTLLETGVMMLQEDENVYTEYTTKDTYKIRQ